MDDKRTRDMIQRINEEQIPDDVNLWPDILKQIKSTPRRQAMSRVPHTRKGWLIVVLAALLTVGAAAAVDRLLNLRGDAGLESANQQGLVTHLDITKSEGDTSVTLEYAYADSNRITIAYTLNTLVKPDFSGSVYALPDLRDDQGHVFSAVISGGGGGGGGGGDESGPTPTAVMVSSTNEFNYDVLESLGNAETLNLMLQVDVYQSDDPAMLDTNRSGKVASLQFPFTIPFYKGLVWDKGQTVTAAGIQMTLQRVVVTPSMARLLLCFDQPPAISDDRWWPEIQVTIGGKTVGEGDTIWNPFTPENAANPMPANCLIETLAQDLSASTGEWKVSIPDVYSAALSGKAAETYTLERVKQFGVEVVPQPGGGYGYTPPEGMDHGQLGEIIRQIGLETAVRIRGPWEFTLTMQ